MIARPARSITTVRHSLPSPAHRERWARRGAAAQPPGEGGSPLEHVLFFSRPPIVAVWLALLAALPLAVPAFAAEPTTSAKSSTAQHDPSDKAGLGTSGAATSDAPADEAPPPRASKVRKGPSIHVEPNSVTVVAEHGKRKTLWIDYRWNLHDKASVEVRLVTGQKAAKGVIVVPVYFVGEQLNAQIQQRAYRCLDRAGDATTTDSFTADKMVYKIIGQRNSLGRPALYVLPYTEGGTPAERPGAVFLQLDAWAINDHLLSLDLPRDGFTEAGTLFVWFLRGDRMLWEKKVAWPGYGKQGTADN